METLEQQYRLHVYTIFYAGDNIFMVGIAKCFPEESVHIIRLENDS